MDWRGTFSACLKIILRHEAILKYGIFYNVICVYIMCNSRYWVKCTEFVTTFVLNCCLVSKIKCRNHVLRSWQKLEIPLEQKQHFRKTTTAAIYFAASQKP